MRRRSIWLPTVVACLAAAAAAHAESWVRTAGADPEFKQSVAICKAAVPLPPAGSAARGAPADCNSSDLLYGIGRAADPAAARACALREMAAGENTTGGAATLATIYANGAGVPRDDDLAIAYACEIDGAPFETDGRVKHLATRKAKGLAAEPFDLCDDVTSGLMQGFCAERDGDRADAKRALALAELTAKLSAPARAAFTRLQKAEDDFVKRSADGEVDVSGTARGALIVGSQQMHRDGFLAALRAMLSGQIGSAQPAREADRQLNATYGKVMALKDTAALGTVTKSGIKDAQRAWLLYRDSFLAFARVAAPAVPPEALAAELTRARTKDLAAFLPA